MNKTITTIVIVLAISTGILGMNTVLAEEDKIPSWIKNVFGYYAEDKVTDQELLYALEFLIADGIIQIEEETYEPFSLEKFPETGGFNPAWLEGEHAKILKNCQEASEMGFENKYCQYLR